VNTGGKTVFLFLRSGEQDPGGRFGPKEEIFFAWWKASFSVPRFSRNKSFVLPANHKC